MRLKALFLHTSFTNFKPLVDLPAAVAKLVDALL